MIPAPLRIPAFRSYWVARLAATIAQMAMVIVIGWQVYDIARQTMDVNDAALRLGLIGVVQFVPLFCLSLVAGWVADHVDRRIVARAAVALELACAATLAIVAWQGAMSLGWLYAIAGLLGVARAFAGPALLFAISLVGLLRIGPVERPTPSNASPATQVAEGLRYVRRNRLVLGAISLDLFAVLLGGATAMLPIFARDILHAGPAGLGHLRAAPALGATLTAMWFAFRPLKTNVGVKMLLAVAVFGAATVVFGLSRSMPLSLACLALLGAADMLSVYVRQSLIQLHTPDAMRGRVGAVSTLFISASNELGEAESGFLAALVGPIVAVVSGGIGAIAVVAIWAWRFPQLRLATSFDAADVSAARAKETPA